jgi:hypothetical protein
LDLSADAPVFTRALSGRLIDGGGNFEDIGQTQRRR